LREGCGRRDRRERCVALAEHRSEAKPVAARPRSFAEGARHNDFLFFARAFETLHDAADAFADEVYYLVFVGRGFDIGIDILESRAGVVTAYVKDTVNLEYLVYLFGGVTASAQADRIDPGIGGGMARCANKRRNVFVYQASS
jgi:hypothetical protein